MKKLILLLSILTLMSCSSDDDSGDVHTSVYKDIVTILPQGNWEVTTYIDDGEDKTIAFDTFVFTFKEDNSVIAKNDLFTETGTWAYQNGNNSDDNDEELILQFNQTTPFDEISDDWEILSVNNVKVELKDDSGNDVDLLTFEKM
jgi:hypothetical protein